MSESSIKILVTGSNGQVGSELRSLESKFPAYKFKFTDRSNLDIGSTESIEEIFREFRPDYLINAAAYTAVDKAEEESEMAFKINADAVKLLLDACKKYPCWFMHISSDYVYHLDTDQALKETDLTEPKGVYAKSKLQGDNVLTSQAEKFCILRTSWVYSFYGHNFVKTMIRLGLSRDELTIVADQVGSPTYAKDIAEALLKMIGVIDSSSDKSKLSGVFNFSNGGQTHWADYAAKIFSLEGISCQVHHTTTEAYGAPAPRPKWSVLDKSRIKQCFNIDIKPWEESLKSCLLRLKSEEQNS